MNWFFIALGAPFLWALVNIADKYLVSRFSQKEKERSSAGLVLFSSLIGMIISLLIFAFVRDVFSVPLVDILLLLFCGTLTIVWVVLYLFTLEIEDASAVVPWFLSVPVFGYLLGYILLGETLKGSQILGSGIIFIGLILISFDFSKGNRKLKHKPLLYMLTASVSVALAGVVFKYVTVGNSFWVSSFWEYLGLGLSGLLIFLFIPHYRESFFHMNRTGGRTIFLVNTLSELASVTGNLLTNFSLLLAPVTMVYLVGSFQPVIVLFLSILGTKFFPNIVKEDISSETLIKKILALLIVVGGSAIFFL